MADFCARHAQDRDGWQVLADLDSEVLATYPVERYAVQDAVGRCRESGGGTVSVYDAWGRVKQHAPVGAQRPH